MRREERSWNSVQTTDVTVAGRAGIFIVCAWRRVPVSRSRQALRNATVRRYEHAGNDTGSRDVPEYVNQRWEPTRDRPDRAIDND